MADRWLFAGGGQETARVVVTGLQTNVLSARRDTTYSDHVVGPNFAANSQIAYDFIDSASTPDAAVTGEKLFIRFTAFQNNNPNTGGIAAAITNGSDQPWLAIRAVSSSTFGLYYNSNTGASPTWTRLGTATHAGAASGVYTFVVWVTLGSPHTVGWAVYNYGTASWTAVEDGMTFTAASFTSAAALSIYSPASNVYFMVSEVAATVGIDLVGSHVSYIKPTGAGSNSGFTGAATAIDDVGLDEADSISSGTAGQRSTFAYGNIPTLAGGEAVGDVFLVTRAKNDGANPTNVKPVRRTSGGTDNVGSSVSGITSTYQTFVTRYSGLSESEVNGSEFGVESAA